VEKAIVRVCFICNEYPPSSHGGIGSITQILARELVKRGSRAVVVGIDPNAGPVPCREMDQGVEVYRLRLTAAPKIGWLKTRYDLYRYVAGRARAGEFDVLDVPDYEGWNAGWGDLPLPVVVRLNGSASYFRQEMGKRMDRLMYLIEHHALRRADFCCSTSRYTAEKTRELFGLNGREIRILYNFVEVTGDCSPWAPVGKRVVYTGTLTPKKGVIPLLQAWKLLLKSVQDAELHLYGRDGVTQAGGSMREYLQEQLSDEEKLTVFFHDRVPREEILRTLQTARAAVFPSFSEAFSLAPMEAMAQGCPTVYSSLSSGPELMRDGEDGLLVDPGKPAEISDALTRILSSPEFAARLGEAGRCRVRDAFSPEAALSQNLAFYRDCIARFSSRYLNP
jgi:glycogen synthase